MRKSTKEEIPRDDGTTHLTGNSYTIPQNGNRPTQTDMAQSEALSPPRDSGQGRQGGREEERALGAEDAEEKRSLHTRGWRKQTRPEGGGSGIVTETERVAPRGGLHGDAGGQAEAIPPFHGGRDSCFFPSLFSPRNPLGEEEEGEGVSLLLGKDFLRTQSGGSEIIRLRIVKILTAALAYLFLAPFYCWVPMMLWYLSDSATQCAVQRGRISLPPSTPEHEVEPIGESRKAIWLN